MRHRDTTESTPPGRVGQGSGNGPARLCAPRPATVRHNNWRGVGLASTATFRPRLPVSVVMPYYDAQHALELTLAALDGQDYPRHLVEVVVVDDGSPTPPDVAGTDLDVAVVRQPRRGFGLARARNNGARVARHDILVFLDGDMIPDSGMLTAHARWHHTVSDALTLGLRTFVDPSGIDVAAVRRHAGNFGALFESGPTDPDWRGAMLGLTDDLASAHDLLWYDRPFRAMSGCNFAMRRTFYLDVGGSDESFTGYGLEDTELAWRVEVRGGLIVPLRDAHSWHQGRLPERSRSRAAYRPAAVVAHRIAHPPFREVACGAIWRVPRHVITVPVADEPASRVAATVDALLADPETDLVVRVAVADWRADAESLRARYGAHPRVSLGTGQCALDEYPAAPLHLAVAPVALPRGGVVEPLRRALGQAAVAVAALPGGARITIAHAWVLHRVRRAGGAPGDYGKVRRVRLRSSGGPGPTVERTPSYWGRLRAGARWLVAEAVHVRDPRSARLFVRRVVHHLRDQHRLVR